MVTRKLSFSILCILLLALSSVSAETQERSATEDWLSILSHVVSDSFIQSKLGKIGSLLHFGGFEPSPHNCLICTLFLGTTMNYCQIHNKTIDKFIMKEFCPMFPLTLRVPCQQFINQYGPAIIDSLVKHSSVDQACRDIKVCEKKECNMFPKQFHQDLKVSQNWTQNIQADPEALFKAGDFKINFKNLTSFQDSIIGKLLKGKASFEELDAIVNFIERLENEAGENPYDWIKELIEKWTGNHTSPIDIDGDKFSTLTPSLRGYNWRGRDCNDADAKIYPGRKTDPNPSKAVDYNCNGIKGKNSATGKTYKEELCANSKQMGVVVMGDSAGAHAELPVSWLNASMWDSNTFTNMVEVILNEVDLPHMSAYTGYMETAPQGPVKSVYKNLYQRNKCNFRDYHNIAVNGGASDNSMKNIMKLGRDKTNDHPVLIFLELIGNDVCNHKHSFDVMTTPEAFKKNIIAMLDYIDSVVPTGSHLFALGLANGSLIYQAVEGRTHPIGVGFDRFYEFQNCIDVSFCWGWLNTDKKTRDATTKRSEELNAVYRDLVKTYKPKNFDFVYYDFPTNEIFADHVKSGGDPLELVEPTDGFHPSQLFHAKLGDWLWNTLTLKHSDWIGPENPNNELITKLFGNQGGY